MAKTLVDVFRNLGFEPRSYSGRGMFGRQCVGVSGDSSELKEAIKDAIGELIDDASSTTNEESIETPSEIGTLDDIRELAQTLVTYEQDSLGMGVIFYWPSEEWSEEYNEKE